MNKTELQELRDKMVTGCSALEPRAAVEVAFRNYERSIAAPLKSVLDRDWEDENLYTISQIAANGITYRDREIAQLKKEIEALKKTRTTFGGYTAAEIEAIKTKNHDLSEANKVLSEMLGTKWSWDWSSTPPALFGGSTNAPRTATGATLNQKPLVFSEAENIPCTAELEVKLQKLAAYFEKRAKENTKRSEKLEKKADSFQLLGDYVQNERSSYYFSGKADSYERAAAKVRELLG